MLDGTLPLINNFDKASPYSKVDTANAMPTNPLRLVESINQNLKSKKYVKDQNIKELYSQNSAPSALITTEKYLKSKSILTPVYVHNEAKTKYDMISKIPYKKIDLNSQVSILA